MTGQWGMGDMDLATVESSCRALREQLGGPWDWDGRFGSAVFAYRLDRADEVRAAVEGITPLSWRHDELGDAPEVVKALVRTFGSLYPGQTFLCSGVESPPILVAALWPWGDGQRISLRFACATHGLDDEAAAEAAAIVMRCFEVG